MVLFLFQLDPIFWLVEDKVDTALMTSSIKFKYFNISKTIDVQSNELERFLTKKCTLFL